MAKASGVMNLELMRVICARLTVFLSSTGRNISLISILYTFDP